MVSTLRYVRCCILRTKPAPTPKILQKQIFEQQGRLQFSTLLRHSIVKDMVCFYVEERRKFSCIMQLGTCALLCSCQRSISTPA